MSQDWRCETVDGIRSRRIGTSEVLEPVKYWNQSGEGLLKSPVKTTSIAEFRHGLFLGRIPNALYCRSTANSEYAECDKLGNWETELDLRTWLLEFGLRTQ